MSMMIWIFAFFFFFFSSRRRHTRCREVSWARRCVQETGGINAEYMGKPKNVGEPGFDKLVQRWFKTIEMKPFKELKDFALYQICAPIPAERVQQAQKFGRVGAVCHYRISSLAFEIHFKTKFGLVVTMVGSLTEFGKWNSQKAYKMEWAEGHIWKSSVFLGPTPPSEIEYKYALQSASTMSINKWENCGNRRLYISEIERMLNTPEHSSAIQHSKLYRFYYKGISMSFNSEKELLQINDKWAI
eukprot:TRINITY_DN34498_c0_g1_i2.p1 TRINITY_DN34498_c0_g1~~TRINITY_DN34498_c0_g1_i2.p1  ORF type:complete len:277 (-),score=64.49 TRINITY_DN34498_c0_g1_i2:218-949(-)